jgi:hypothetical protein
MSARSYGPVRRLNTFGTRSGMNGSAQMRKVPSTRCSYSPSSCRQEKNRLPRHRWRHPVRRAQQTPIPLLLADPSPPTLHKRLHRCRRREQRDDPLILRSNSPVLGDDASLLRGTRLNFRSPRNAMAAPSFSHTLPLTLIRKIFFDSTWKASREISFSVLYCKKLSSKEVGSVAAPFNMS